MLITEITSAANSLMCETLDKRIQIFRYGGYHIVINSEVRHKGVSPDDVIHILVALMNVK